MAKASKEKRRSRSVRLDVPRATRKSEGPLAYCRMAKRPCIPYEYEVYHRLCHPRGTARESGADWIASRVLVHLLFTYSVCPRQRADRAITKGLYVFFPAVESSPTVWGGPVPTGAAAGVSSTYDSIRPDSDPTSVIRPRSADNWCGSPTPVFSWIAPAYMSATCTISPSLRWLSGLGRTIGILSSRPAPRSAALMTASVVLTAFVSCFGWSNRFRLCVPPQRQGAAMIPTWSDLQDHPTNPSRYDTSLGTPRGKSTTSRPRQIGARRYLMRTQLRGGTSRYSFSFKASLGIQVLCVDR